MKSNTLQTLKRTLAPKLQSLVSTVLLLSWAHAIAKIPEPDLVFWGAITVDGQAITAQQSDVRVEASLGPNGPVIATYRMGDDPDSGDFYVLRVPVESLAPKLNLLTARIGESVQIEVLSAVQVFEAQPQTVIERGQISRLDLMFGRGGGDTNGLPDDWERQYFGATGQLAAGDFDLDGSTNRQEFDAETDPTDPTDNLFLVVDNPQGIPRIQFLARQAEGPGYDGFVRFFTLESAVELEGLWQNIPDTSDLLGQNQIVTYTAPGSDGYRYFRLRVLLLQQ